MFNKKEKLKCKEGEVYEKCSQYSLKNSCQKICSSQKLRWETDKQNNYIMWENDLNRVNRGDNWSGQWTCTDRCNINGHSWMTCYYCEKSQWQRLTASRSGKNVGRLACTHTSCGCSSVLGHIDSQQYLLHLS